MRYSRMLHLWLGLRLAWRGLRRSPGTSAGAALTLAISFSAVAVLLGVYQGSTRPLPVPDSHQLIRIELLDARAAAPALPNAPASTWAVGPGIAAAGGLIMQGGTLALPGVPAVRAAGAALEPVIFPLLGLTPARGRWLSADPNDASAIVLGWDLFQQLGGSADLLGAELRLDDVPHTIVGIMPPGFGFPEKQSYWTVLEPRSPLEQVVARMDGAATIESARSALDVRLRSLPVAREAAGPYRSRLRPWHTGRGEGGEALAFAGLAVLVAVLVVICAANVSTLLLVRASERTSTLAVHAALGAARSQVAYVLFLEALLVSVAGGLLGLIAGAWALHWLELNLSMHWGYYWMRMELQPGVVAGLFLVVLLAALLAGTAPALRAARIDLRAVLADGGRGESGRRRRWLGRGFVWAQVSLSTMGLVAALLLGSGVLRLGRFGAELPLEEVAVGTVMLPPRHQPAARRAQFLAELRRELLRIPGVQSVTLASGIPGLDHATTPFSMAGEVVDVAAAGARRGVGWLAADEGLLATYGIELLRGRNFSPGDVESALPVALVTESFAAEQLSGRDPIGARLRLDGVHGDDHWAEVVGVVSDWRVPDQRGGAGRVIVPLAQVPAGSIHIAARSADPGTAVPGLRQAVARVDESIAMEGAQTLDALVAWLLRMPRVLAGFGVIGGLTGVVVAAIGLYAVIAFQVRSQLSEIGVRLALGARPAHLLRELLRETLIRVVPGVLAGSAVAAGSMHALGFLAGGQQPRSPALYLAALVIMLVVAAAAALGPALRAARVDPLAIMRRN